MSAYKLTVAVVATSLITGCMWPYHMMGRRGMAGRTHDEGMLDSAIRVTHTSLMARADSMLDQTAKMVDATASGPDSSTMTTARRVGDSTPPAAVQLHDVAIGVRALVRRCHPGDCVS